MRLGACRAGLFSIAGIANASYVASCRRSSLLVLPSARPLLFRRRLGIWCVAVLTLTFPTLREPVERQAAKAEDGNEGQERELRRCSSRFRSWWSLVVACHCWFMLLFETFVRPREIAVRVKLGEFEPAEWIGLVNGAG